MKTPKFLSLLKTFDVAQRRRFRKYLSSPLYNEQERLLVLFDFCLDQLEMPWDKQAAWEALFGDEKPFDDLTLRRMLSKLTGFAEHFKTLEVFEASPAAFSGWMLRALNEPALSKHFVAALRRAKALGNRPGIQQPLVYHYLQQQAREEYRHSELLNPRKPCTEALERADYALDCYYFSTKLKNYCEMLGYAQMQAVAPKIHLWPGLLRYLEEHSFLEEPVLRAYYLVANMLEKPEEEHFFLALRQMLDADYELFARTELQTLFVHLMNYCIYTKINRGRSDYFKELFVLYQSALRYGILEENALFDPFHYKNIITVGLHVGEPDWVEFFIREYTPRLPASERENALAYNMAKVHFYRKEYEQVVRLLSAVEYSDLFYALGSRLMLLKTYYELGEDLALDSLIDSFRIYLLRNRLISREVRQQYMKVLRFVRKMFYLSPHDKAAIRKLKEELAGAKNLADKAWLMEKVKELG